MKRPPTDREILKKIHDRYLIDFGDFDLSASEPTRESKIYAPIDCRVIASDLNVDPDIVFGRLYYHLNKKYGYRQDDGSKVELFAFKVGKDKHAVNFPLLSAVLAELHQSWFRFTAPLVLSAAAFIFSILSLACRGS
ncbi:hypothetical protein [Nitrosococcus watsonii]|uniref:Uncharacterized protein n=1 Tax=Nitrosococcus watsoni (strain C-113) TaxID=105559 RepID=D8K9Y8_NITWC|nr:hypothetical protein [Nitrosococcus watsonii]ADJ29346.1 conserved hypothetical protein [Nitrosococcus watsonii C-113]